MNAIVRLSPGGSTPELGRLGYDCFHVRIGPPTATRSAVSGRRISSISEPGMFRAGFPRGQIETLIANFTPYFIGGYQHSSRSSARWQP